MRESHVLPLSTAVGLEPLISEPLFSPGRLVISLKSAQTRVKAPVQSPSRSSGPDYPTTSLWALLKSHCAHLRVRSHTRSWVGVCFGMAFNGGTLPAAPHPAPSL